jgi:hypothetical protein
MRQFQASAVERRICFKGNITSHPMEAGWASEAIFFLIVEEIKGAATLKAHVEISPDGINWIKEGSIFPDITAPGYYCCKVSHFGNWLRVHGDIAGADAEIKASVQLHLKS